MKHFVYCCTLVLLSACTDSPELGIAANYFPTTSKLTAGVVNKYYHHYYPGEGKDSSTDILYQAYRLTEAGELEVRYYNAGLELTRTRRLVWADSALLLRQETNFFTADTVPSVVRQPTVIHWQTDNVSLERTQHYPEGTWYAIGATARSARYDCVR